ncbi:MAG: hypothetical protein LN413_00335 [Candidatus Thermoplasmatota archaeon]|nr:hypothetical protein [Candidatus Thermoplasmatota archaeon]
MSVYNLVMTGVQTILATDTPPLKINLPSAIKLSSSIVLISVNDLRRPVLVQRGSIAAANPDTSPKDATITAVQTNATQVTGTVRYDRLVTDSERSATLKLQSTTLVRLEWDGTLAAGETITAEFEAVEHRAIGSINARLLNEASQDKIEFDWPDDMQTGETIKVSWEVHDLENLGDDMKDVLFRLQGILGYLGENLVQDLIVSDQAGNLTQYRMRVFQDKATANAATLNLADGSPLETGEQRRTTVTQNVIKAKNTRSTMRKVLDLILSPVPGVD